HCGSSASPLTKRCDELNTEEAFDLIDQLKEIKTDRIILSGGEPFLRKDWEAIVTHIVACDIVPGYISNGFLFDEDKAKKLKRLNRSDLHVGVSVDGDEETHDYIRQTKGSFKKAMRALEILREQGIYASVVTQVNMLNFKLLPKIRDAIFARCIYNWQIQLATPWGRLAENPELLLTPKDYLELVRFIVEHRKIFREKVTGADDIGYYTELENYIRPNTEWAGCHAGLRCLGVTSNGGITGCLSLQEPQFIEGNIRKERLTDIWYDPNRFSYNRSFKEEYLEGYCRECPHRMKCRGGCKNTSFAYSRTPYNNYYCCFRIMLGKEAPTVQEMMKNRSSGGGCYHP
ncbi:MAG: radical SAM protein, partial [Candidatus Omnitrophica bacterium]|nr:radical SAM protein [Candidatus Omnitrophota bacterium]